MEALLSVIAIAQKIYELVNTARNTVVAVGEIIFTIRKIVGHNGSSTTQIVCTYDTDGDGEYDAEDIIYSLDVQIPDLSAGYCICNRGNDIGIGIPEFTIIDYSDFFSCYESLDKITYNGHGYLCDLDGDGVDDVVYPFELQDPQRTYNYCMFLVDDDDNGIPDASPYCSFYPVGSQEYIGFVEQQKTQLYEEKALDKPFSRYTVSEALLFLIFVGSAVAMISKIFKRRKL